MKTALVVVASLVPFALLGAETATGIVVDKSVSPQATSAWLAYAGTVGTALRDGKSSDRFDVQLAAHETMLRAWRETKRAENGGDEYLDAVSAVQDTGYLGEYVWAHFRTPAWGAAPAELKLPEYYRWRAEHQSQLQPQLLAAVRTATQISPVSAWTHDAKEDVYTHYYSGCRFPRRMASFTRKGVRDMDIRARDVMVFYEGSDQCHLTVHVYPLLSPASKAAASFDQELKRLQKEVVRGQFGAQLVAVSQRKISSEHEVWTLSDLTWERERLGEKSVLPARGRLLLAANGEDFITLWLSYSSRSSAGFEAVFDNFVKKFSWP
jgi:hypothetical protein